VEVVGELSCPKHGIVLAITPQGEVVCVPCMGDRVTERPLLQAALMTATSVRRPGRVTVSQQEIDRATRRR
jgi:hypothetical protein